MSLGISFLAFVAGLQTIDKNLYEAGVMDGIKNRFQELWYITLPSMIPQLVFGAVMQIVVSFSVADISIQLAGFPSTEYAGETLVTHIMDYGTIRYEMGYASAMAVVVFLMMVFTNRIVSKLLHKVGA
jgi:multiple sugar transport system permease protein